MDCYYFVRQDRISQIKLFFAGPGLFFFTKTILWKKANDLVKLLYDIDNKIGKIMIINNNVLSTHDENNRDNASTNTNTTHLIFFHSARIYDNETQKPSRLAVAPLMTTEKHICTRSVNTNIANRNHSRFQGTTPITPSLQQWMKRVLWKHSLRRCLTTHIWGICGKMYRECARAIVSPRFLVISSPHSIIIRIPTRFDG